MKITWSDEFYIDLILLSVYAFLFFIIYSIKEFSPSINSHPEINENIHIEDYRDYFGGTFSDADLTRLIKGATRRTLRTDDTKITREGNICNRVFYFASIPKEAVVTFKSRNVVIGRIKQGSWFGLVEFYMGHFEKASPTWLVEVDISSSNQNVVWLEWEMDVKIVLT